MPQACILFIMIFLLREYCRDFILVNNFSCQSNDDAYQVACIGDSWTCDSSLSLQDNYPAQLEEILNEKQNDVEFKVHNFGMPLNKSFKILNIGLKKSKFNAIVVLGPEKGELWDVFSLPFSAMELFNSIKQDLNIKKAEDEIETIVSDIININKVRKKDNVYSSAQMNKIEENIKNGNVCRKNGQAQEAVNFYKKVLDIDSNNLGALIELSRCLKLSYRNICAIKILIFALKEHSYENELYEELDDNFSYLDGINMETEIYSELFKSNQNNNFIRERFVRALFLQGTLLCYRDKFREAANCLRKAFELDPHNKNEGLKELYEITKAEDKKKMKDFFRKPTFTLFTRKTGRSKSGDINAGFPINFYHVKLKELAGFCRRKNILLILASYPHRDNKYIKELAIKNGIPFINNYSCFEKLIEAEGKEKYFKSPHCTKKGYSIIAGNIAKEILKRINVQP